MIYNIPGITKRWVHCSLNLSIPLKVPKFVNLIHNVQGLTRCSHILDYESAHYITHLLWEIIKKKIDETSVCLKNKWRSGIPKSSICFFISFLNALCIARTDLFWKLDFVFSIIIFFFQYAVVQYRGHFCVPKYNFLLHLIYMYCINKYVCT